MGKIDNIVDGMEKVRDGADKLLYEDVPEEELIAANGKHRKRPKNRRLSLWKVKLIGAAIVVLLIAVLIFKWKASNWFDDIVDRMNGEHIEVTESTLINMLDITELSTVSCDYSSIVSVPKEGFWKTTDHSVSYNAEIQMGIDFSKIKVSVDNENGEIRVKLPEVEIINVSVDASSMDFLNEKDKDDTDFVLEAYKACRKDVEAKIKKEEALYGMAECNAEGAVKGLFQPILASVKKEYKIVFE